MSESQTAYGKISAEMCRECANGTRVDPFIDPQSHIVLEGPSRCYTMVPCTAPTPEQLAQALLVAREGLLKHCSIVNGGKPCDCLAANTLKAIEAALRGQTEGEKK